VGFFQLLIDSLAGFYAIDRQRIFVAGMSNGGHMAYRLACDLPDKIAGIAAVAALLPAELKPSQPVPTLIIAGMDDPIVPYKGGAVQVGMMQRGVVRSAMETLRIWSEANRCGGEPTTELLDDVDPRDRMSVQQTFYRDCVAAVMLYTVIGGGHTWPGGQQYLNEQMIGRTCRDIDANRVIWNFFRELPHG
jgi:polyhydroxybutyrate depolymerase